VAYHSAPRVEQIGLLCRSTLGGDGADRHPLELSIRHESILAPLG
jgi:hypothetical protein